MTVSSGVPYSLTFGASKDNSNTAIIGDVGGQTVTIKGSNDIVYSIQIGDKLYGSTKGTSQPPTGSTGILPADGTFSLFRLDSIKEGPIRYVEFKMDGAPVTGGSPREDNVNFKLSDGLKVKFGSIMYTSEYINQIQFLLVS